MTSRACLAALAIVASGCASAAPLAPVPELRPGVPAGYLPQGAAPSSLSLAPDPPAAGSAAQGRDDAASQAGLALRGSPRWSLAAKDADLRFPAAAQTFACALDVEVSEAATPRLYLLLRRTMVDIGRSTVPSKQKFQRPRPFMINGAPTCSPNEEASLRKDGSYPSGHSALGWGWSLILAEAAPERADAVLARGRAFGQSRVVCNVHWLSDTEEGRMMGAATVSRLHADPQFRADLAAATAEIAAARAAGRKPGGDCVTEAAQLAR